MSDDEQALGIAHRGLKLACIDLPWISGLVQTVRVEVDARVPVAAVTESGRILINASVFSTLPIDDAMFVMAHEVMHLAFDTFRRSSNTEDRELVNYAHDYIINGFLYAQWHRRPPLGGLFWAGAVHNSLEVIIKWMKDAEQKPENLKSWSAKSDSPLGSSGTLGGLLQDAGIHTPQLRRQNEVEKSLMGGDMIFADSEAILSPSVASDRHAELTAITREIDRAGASRAVVAQLRLREEGNGKWLATTDEVQQVAGQYRTPWESALQRWMEAVAPGRRSYSRPSRRGGAGGAWVRPGRLREGWTLHIVLDTSGSMIDDLPHALDAISEFAATVGVVDVHVVQCDDAVNVDQWVSVDELGSYEIRGYGGSDMTQGMEKVDEDEEATAMIVITDGCIDYPQQPPRCDVLWAVIGQGEWWFEPSYGEVLNMFSDQARA